MAYGLEMKNLSGITMIDDSWSGLVVVQSGSVAVSSDVASGTAITYANYGFPPIIMVRPPAGVFIGYAYASNYYTATQVRVYTSSAATVQYAVCVNRVAAGIPTDTSYGLSIHNSSGQQIFSTDRLQVHMDTGLFVDWRVNGAATANYTVALPSIGSRYLMLNSFLYTEVLWTGSDPMYKNIWKSEAAINSETSIGVRSRQFSYSDAGWVPPDPTNPYTPVGNTPLIVAGAL